MFELGDIGYDKFIRTTDQNHHTTVQNVWKTLSKSGFIQIGEHSGFYSVNEESFIMEKDLEFDGSNWNCGTGGGVYLTQLGEVVNKVTEKNYTFEFKQEILREVRKWAQSAVTPVSVRNKVLDDLKEDSRP